MTGILDGLFHVLAFVKTCIIHHNNGAGRQLWNEIACQPAMEDITVDIAWKQAGCQQGASQQRADDICSSPRVPVMGATTALAFGRIAMGAGHIMGKT